MHVLVIGGAGYIGSHVVKFLLKTGNKVRVFDDMSTGQKINLFKEAEFVKGSILNTKDLDKAMQGIDAVIHLAAKKSVGESMLETEKYSENNLVGTANVLNTMCRHLVKYFIFSSSAAVYGIPKVSEITEAEPINPINFYGYTKSAIEDLLKWYDKLKGIRFVSLRYFNAVGYDPEGRIKGLEKNPQNLLPIIMETAMGIRKNMYVYGNDYDTPDGTCVRDYIHVSDLARAHVMALDYLEKHDTSEIMNLGTGRGFSVLEMIKMTEKVIGKKINYNIGPRRLGDPASLTSKSTKATELLGWQPIDSDLETIVSSTWAVYNAQK